MDNEEDEAEPQDSRESQKDSLEARAVALHDFASGSCIGEARSMKLVRAFLLRQFKTTEKDNKIWTRKNEKR